jgi:hypothetical protein
VAPLRSAIDFIGSIGWGLALSEESAAVDPLLMPVEMALRVAVFAADFP